MKLDKRLQFNFRQPIDALSEGSTIVVFRNGLSAIYQIDSSYREMFIEKDFELYLSNYNNDLIDESNSAFDIMEIYQLENNANLSLVWKRKENKSEI